jgi:hypothetical protein
VISPARNRDSETGFIPARIPATSGVPKLEDRVSSNSVATHRARVFREKAGTFDLSFGSPPAWQSALREYRERQPRRPPSKTIAIHESTDGPAILRRVFSEPIEPDENDLGPDVRDEGI